MSGEITMNVNTQETLALLKTAQAASNADIIAKNFTQPSTATTGLQAYDLEAPSKKLYPVLTPLRNRIARVGGGFSIQANWKAITGINSQNIRVGVSEGKRGAQISHTLTENLAAYRGIGLEKSVTFEADYAARGFEDLKAGAVLQSLQGLMVAEELIILGGNTSLALGTTPTPTLSQGGSGTLGNATYSVICVALGLQAYWDLAGANNGNVNQSLNLATATVPAQIVRTNADGTTDTFGGGSAQKSAAASLAVTGAQNLFATVAAVRGAYAYAWFVGTAGSEKLEKVTTINSVSFTTALAGVGQLATALTGVDSSTSVLEFDGLLTQAAKSANNAYFNALATGTPGTGTTLTAGSGRIVEIDVALANYYQQYRCQPSDIYLNFNQFQKITNLVLGSTNPNVQFIVDPNSPMEMVAGRNVGKYLSPITGEIINLVVHPNMPPGTMMFYTGSVPAYVDGVTDICRVRTRQEYYQIEWPLRTRKYEYAVYADEVLQHFIPFTLGIISNIA
jgi:hypothetical protein